MLATAGIAGFLVAGGPAPALATCTVTGDGTPFATIQAAVNAGAFSINFTGTCDPFVFIFHPVQLTGTGATPADNAITQGISVDGAPRVTITNVQIGGDTSNLATSGIFFVDGANVKVQNSNLATTLQGVEVIRGSVARIFNSTIHGRTLGASNANACNVCAIDSIINLVSSTITMNESNGKVGALSVARNSDLLLRGGNSITNMGSVAAIDVDFNSSLREDDPGIEASPPVDGTPDAITGGMLILGKSYADWCAGHITGNVTVDLDSVFRVPVGAFGGEPEDVVISGNITAKSQSNIVIGSSLTHVMGNVACLDKESHLSGSPTITGTNTCTPF